MEHIFLALKPFIRGVARHPLVVIAAGLALAALAFGFALNLRIDSDLSALIPPHYASVQALEKLRDQVGGESEAAVAIESPSFDWSRR